MKVTFGTHSVSPGDHRSSRGSGPAVPDEACWRRRAGRPARCPLASSTLAQGDLTAWLRMQSEAKRSPRRSSLQFAICREIFRNCRESRCIGCQIFQCFQPFKGSSPYLASSEHFSVLQGRAARDCECSRVGFADSTSAVAGAAARRRMEPDARRRNSDICPFPETAYRLAGNKGGSGARPPRRRLQGEPFNVSSETAHHPKGKDMPVAMRPNKVIRSAARMCSGTSRRDQGGDPISCQTSRRSAAGAVLRWRMVSGLYRAPFSPRLLPSSISLANRSLV
jgi:hypothetical protein